MPESAKEGDSVLPEGSDIDLGPGDRAFESHYSDQRKRDSEITDFRAPFSCSMSTARLDPNPSKSTGLGSSPGQIQEHHVLLHSTSERH